MATQVAPLIPVTHCRPEDIIIQTSEATAISEKLFSINSKVSLSLRPLPGTFLLERLTGREGDYGNEGCKGKDYNCTCNNCIPREKVTLDDQHTILVLECWTNKDPSSLRDELEEQWVLTKGPRNNVLVPIETCRKLICKTTTLLWDTTELEHMNDEEREEYLSNAGFDTEYPDGSIKTVILGDEFSTPEEIQVYAESLGYKSYETSIVEENVWSSYSLTFCMIVSDLKNNTEAIATFIDRLSELDLDD